jgi:hypothetical protein
MIDTQHLAVAFNSHVSIWHNIWFSVNACLGVRSIKKVLPEFAWMRIYRQLGSPPRLSLARGACETKDIWATGVSRLATWKVVACIGGC